MSDFPDMSAHRRLSQTSGRQWRNAFETLERFRRHEAGIEVHGHTPPPHPATDRKFVVVQGINTEYELLAVQEVGYADTPPHVGRYQWVGDQFHAWPLVGSTLDAFAELLWGNDYIDTSAPILRAHRLGTEWYVEPRGESVATMAYVAVLTLVPYNGTLFVRRVHYLDPWPVVGQYMWGEALTAFPAVGTELDDFAAHVVVDPGPVPTLETPILLARQFGAHWHVLLPGAAATSVEVDRFLVMAQNEDALLCTFANEPTNDFREWVTVAKPFELRYSSWHIDGVAMRVHCENLDVWMTYTHLVSPSPLSQRYKRRIVTRDDEPGNPYIEVIVPEWRFYTFDSVPPDNLWATIWAAKVGVEITGREFADWQDLNLAGRQWALLGRQDEPP